MKRLAALMLAMMLAAGFLGAAAPASAEAEALHLLWDIPYHISPQECLRLLEEKTGARLRIDEGFGWQQVVTEPDSHVTLFEQKASVWTLVYDSDCKLDSIVLTFESVSLPADASAEQRAEKADIGLQRFEMLRQRLTEAYGPQSSACVLFPASKEETERVVPHQLPMQGSAIDYEELTQTTTDAQAEFSVEIGWNNVRLRYYSHPGHMDGHFLSTDVFFSRAEQIYIPETFADYVRPNYE